MAPTFTVSAFFHRGLELLRRIIHFSQTHVIYSKVPPLVLLVLLNLFLSENLMGSQVVVLHINTVKIVVPIYRNLVASVVFTGCWLLVYLATTIDSVQNILSVLTSSLVI